MFKIDGDTVVNTKIGRRTKIRAVPVRRGRYNFSHTDGTLLAKDRTLDEFIKMYWGKLPSTRSRKSTFTFNW